MAFQCKVCAKVYMSPNGVTNLKQHYDQKHPEELKANIDLLNGKGSSAIISFFPTVVSPEAKELYRWLVLIINKQLPISIVADKYWRDFLQIGQNKPTTPFQPPPLFQFTFTSKKVREVIIMLSHFVEASIAKDAKEVLAQGRPIGLQLDGWTRFRTHYLCCFLTFKLKNKHTSAMFALSPLLDESDFTAISHARTIKAYLGDLQLLISNISFMLSDNESTMRKLARVMAIPMVGCYAHRLNLATKHLLSSGVFVPILTKIKGFMRALATNKGAGMLRKVTEKTAILDNVTRWSSVFSMLQRYPELRTACVSSEELLQQTADYRLSSEEDLQRQKLMDLLREIASVQCLIQRDALELRHARFFLDELSKTVLDSHAGALLSRAELKETFCDRLSPDAGIVESPFFEKAVVKIQTGRGRLTANENEAASHLAQAPAAAAAVAAGVGDVAQEDEVEESLAQRLEAQRREDIYAQRQREEAGVGVGVYHDLAGIEGTTCRVERQFSACRLTLSHLCARTTPELFEAMHILLANPGRWDVGLVQEALVLGRPPPKKWGKAQDEASWVGEKERVARLLKVDYLDDENALADNQEIVQERAELFADIQPVLGEGEVEDELDAPDDDE